MDPLSTALTCLLCAASPSDLPPTMARWEPIIAAASARFSVPASWVAHVMAQESGGLTMLNGKPITSSAGAMGLMQVMPDTYAVLRQRYGFDLNAYDPHDNIFAGAAYLRELYLKYGYPNLFAAYHAGPSRLDDFLERGRPLPYATDAYVAALTGTDSASEARPTSAQRAAVGGSFSALFFVNHAHEEASPAAGSAPSLFITLSTAQR